MKKVKKKSIFGDKELTLIVSEDLNKLKGKNLYELTLKNKGGLVTPIIIEWTFADGSKEGISIEIYPDLTISGIFKITLVGVVGMRRMSIGNMTGNGRRSFLCDGAFIAGRPVVVKGL